MARIKMVAYRAASQVGSISPISLFFKSFGVIRTIGCPELHLAMVPMAH